ncbi:transposase [Eubacterium ramulus]|uniref:IS66 family insertion sequence element accessory protein TnpB n=1 Tax=Eubacterium ramulus TaxID=39490 RepID=UPI0010200AAC|nr:IS66 family insertion sequence element accessory protein TnpB [Eubacterium ramulus]MSC77124.1 IS66 family insertion sequence element accessory protein TnpB [Eubacterium ramulus]MSC95362.1 IS66 family insertion sequence element accessory protein TnpB [Eubacterium ramulus]RYS97071.1 transposase [Eubacterium ramulus]
MLADISNVDAIYIVCGRTDMRKSIDGLCAIIQDQFSMEIDHALYLFCGRKCDRIKAILKEPDGIVMIYKRSFAMMENMSVSSPDITCMHATGSEPIPASWECVF